MNGGRTSLIRKRDILQTAGEVSQCRCVTKTRDQTSRSGPKPDNEKYVNMLLKMEEEIMKQRQTYTCWETASGHQTRIHDGQLASGDVEVPSSEIHE